MNEMLKGDVVLFWMKTLFNDRSLIIHSSLHAKQRTGAFFLFVSFVSVAACNKGVRRPTLFQC